MVDDARLDDQNGREGAFQCPIIGIALHLNAALGFFQAETAHFQL
jgi:hypothetical protein